MAGEKVEYMRERGRGGGVGVVWFRCRREGGARGEEGEERGFLGGITSYLLLREDSRTQGKQYFTLPHLLRRNPHMCDVYCPCLEDSVAVYIEH